MLEPPEQVIENFRFVINHGLNTRYNRPTE